MTLLASVHNRVLVGGFLVNSLPKAGTALLAKAVRLFPGIRPAGVHIGYSTLADFRQQGGTQAVVVPIGVDWPHSAPLAALRQSLQGVGKGRYVTGHLPFSEELAALLAEMGMKSLLILRDPRAVVVSHANYVARTATHFLFEFYQTLSESERIMKSITGIRPTAPDAPVLLGINERCRSVLPWASQSFNYTTYFERLVGPEGGGSRYAQIEELENIARHLHIKHSPHAIEQLAQQVFGGTSTFRVGIGGGIGNWRNHFSPEHEHVFKELAGQIVIDLGYERDCDW